MEIGSHQNDEPLNFKKAKKNRKGVYYVQWNANPIKVWTQKLRVDLWYKTNTPSFTERKKCCNFQFLVRLCVGSYMYIFENQVVTC